MVDEETFDRAQHAGDGHSVDFFLALSLICVLFVSCRDYPPRTGVHGIVVVWFANLLMADEGEIWAAGRTVAWS